MKNILFILALCLGVSAVALADENYDQIKIFCLTEDVGDALADLQDDKDIGNLFDLCETGKDIVKVIEANEYNDDFMEAVEEVVWPYMEDDDEFSFQYEKEEAKEKTKEPKGVYVNTKAYVRSEPSGDSEIVKVYQEMEEIEIEEEDGDWVKTKDGWVLKKHINGLN